MATYTVLNEPTLYPSAYMVLTNKEYTKHYYAGTERVAARIGSGGLSYDATCVTGNGEVAKRSDELFWEGLKALNEHKTKPEDFKEMSLVDAKGKEVDWHKKIDLDRLVMSWQLEAKIDPWKIHFIIDDNSYPAMPGNIRYENEPDVYFYHSDHLGGASWITDANGKPVQHLQYLPFGEPFVDQHPAGYQERFTFTGKERDEETGYGYFGARYMDYSLMTMWLSVDPMSDKYPNISPYNYCMWNPVKLVDPDGRDGDVEVNKDDRSIIVNMNIYYNKTQKNIEYITGREGEDDYNQLDRARQKGFSSKDSWKHIDDDGIEWSVTININFIEKESEEEVQTALENDPVGNKLCIDREYGEAGKWDPNTRTITLGDGSWNRMAIENDAGTLSHEIGHALGLTHPDNTHKGESGDYGIMSYSLNRTVWGSEVSRVASRILKSASNSQDSQVHLHLFGSPIREPSIQTSKK